MHTYKYSSLQIGDGKVAPSFNCIVFSHGALHGLYVSLRRFGTLHNIITQELELEFSKRKTLSMCMVVVLYMVNVIVTVSMFLGNIVLLHCKCLQLHGFHSQRLALR